MAKIDKITYMNNNTEYEFPVWASVDTITVTLESWDRINDEQTVTATWVTASNTVIVSPDPTSMTDYTDGGIYCSAQGNNSLTFTCTTAVVNDIDVNVVIIG